jgi:hypothetical protein
MKRAADGGDTLCGRTGHLLVSCPVRPHCAAQGFPPDKADISDNLPAKSLKSLRAGVSGETGPLKPPPDRAKPLPAAEF